MKWPKKGSEVTGHHQGHYCLSHWLRKSNGLPTICSGLPTTGSSYCYDGHYENGAMMPRPTMVGRKKTWAPTLLFYLRWRLMREERLYHLLLPIAMNLKRMMKKGKKRPIKIVVDDLRPMATAHETVMQPMAKRCLLRNKMTERSLGTATLNYEKTPCCLEKKRRYDHEQNT